ncbi:hypothetical protein FGG08_006992 [Glutinoglossum americanum]|uniref:Uncharacterized protein n=1 Tax=Glutinoglossum americanum TaxID=1670608 RepID=A0A9P8HRL2_9PEZI|nr:hypothetical protein FGG08_006992 [Glutinoglossum americanum]
MGECVTKACSPEDVKKTTEFATELCGSVGVTLPVPTSEAPPPPPEETPAPKPVAPTDVPTPEPVVSVPTTMATVPYPSPVHNATAPCSTGAHATISVAPATFTGSASSVKVGSWLGGAVALAGLVWAL